MKRRKKTLGVKYRIESLYLQYFNTKVTYACVVFAVWENILILGIQWFKFRETYWFEIDLKDLSFILCLCLSYHSLSKEYF